MYIFVKLLKHKDAKEHNKFVDKSYPNPDTNSKF